MAVNFEDLASQAYGREQAMASAYKPILQSDLESAYARYAEVGVKFGNVQKAVTDKELYQKATNDVVAWYKNTKRKAAEELARQQAAIAAEEARFAAEQAAAERAAAQEQAQYEAELQAQQAEASAQAVARAMADENGAGRSGFMLPDTAVSAGGGPTRKPVPIRQRKLAANIAATPKSRPAGPASRRRLPVLL